MQLILLLCVSVSCLSSAYSYHLTINGFREAIELHHMGLGQAQHCHQIIEDEQCTNGLVQKSVDLALQCNVTSDADVLELGCRRNSRGDYCLLATTHQTQVDAIKTTCRNLSSTCTTACRDLLASINEELGCCINTIYNNSNSIFNTPDSFRFSLWSRCGIQPVPKCPPSKIRVIPSHVDPTCDFNSFQDRIINLTCTKSFIQPIIAKLNASGDCQRYGEAVLQACGVDKSKEWCSSAKNLANLTDGIVAAQIACDNTTTCSGKCKHTLQTFDQTSGCCINSVFNNSLAGIAAPSYDCLSYKFWSECGVHTPGICDTKLNG